VDKKNIYVVVKSPNWAMAHSVGVAISLGLATLDIENKLAGPNEKLLFTAGSLEDGADHNGLIKGILFTEHSLNPQTDRVRPAIPKSQVSLQHNLHIAIAGSANSGKTSARCLIGSLLDLHYETIFPFIDITLDGMEKYPDENLRLFLTSPEHVTKMRDKIIVNIIPQQLITFEII